MNRPINVTLKVWKI